MLGNVPSSHISLGTVWLCWLWAAKSTNTSGRCLQQSQPEFWGSIISLLGCRRRKGCGLPTSSERLSLCGAVRSGYREKERKRGLSTWFYSPQLPSLCAKGTGTSCLVHLLGLLVFSQEKPPRALKFPPQLQPFSSEAAAWKSCSADPAGPGITCLGQN